MAIQVELFLQTLIAGILLGGLYALIGIGMTLIMGVMKIINSAPWWVHHNGGHVHCVLAVHSHLLFLFRSHARVVFLWSSPPEHLINPVLKVDSILPENQVILTVGIGWRRPNLRYYFFHFKLSFDTGPIRHESLLSHRFLEKCTHSAFPFSFLWTSSFLIAVVITIALWFSPDENGYRKVDPGDGPRPRCRSAHGGHVGKVRVATFGIGCALVGAAGCLFLPIVNFFPRSVGGQFTLIAFVITILGGLGSTVGKRLSGESFLASSNP